MELRERVYCAEANDSGDDENVVWPPGEVKERYFSPLMAGVLLVAYTPKANHIDETEAKGSTAVIKFTGYKAVVTPCTGG